MATKDTAGYLFTADDEQVYYKNWRGGTGLVLLYADGGGAPDFGGGNFSLHIKHPNDNDVYWKQVPDTVISTDSIFSFCIPAGVSIKGVVAGSINPDLRILVI